MLSQTLRPVSKVSSIRRRAMFVAPTIRTQKQVVVKPVKAHPLVIDFILGSIALYLMVDVGSVIVKDYKEKKEKEDK